jgi:hypothetical protein
MSTVEKPEKISIGFRGGQTLAARVKPAEITKLRDVLGKAEGWHELKAEEGLVLLDLTRIDYLLVDNQEHRVGF